MAWERPEARLIGCFSASLPARASEDRRREIRAMVEGWRESVRTNAEPVSSFAELCRRHSEDAATRYFGGESGWLTRPQWAGRWGGAAGDAIGGLPAVGEVTSIVESGCLLLFFQLRGVRERSVRPLGEVAGILRAERIRRWEDAVSRAVAADLASSIQVRTNQLALEGVEAPVPENPAAAPPPQMIEY